MEVGCSQEHVSSALESLNNTYDSFPIHQTTVSVDQASYDHAVQCCKRGVVDASIRVRHDGGVLVLETDGVEQTPQGIIESTEESIEAGACRLVRELTGVSCHIIDLISANIVGIHDASPADREPIYRLDVLFEAVYDTGELRECASWDASIPFATTS
jgi:hypothetical protein